MGFGVMGGSLQAQGHLQVPARIGGYRQNPQAVVDAPRWRIMDDNVRVMVEWNFPAEAVAGLRKLGHEVLVADRFSDEFGGSQAIMRMDEGYLGASDHRRMAKPSVSEGHVDAQGELAGLVAQRLLRRHGAGGRV